MEEDRTPQLLNIIQPLSAETIPPEQLYSLMGDDGITRLTAAFYQQIPSDDVLAPMYPEDDLDGSETRLRDFLIFRFGGPTHYLTQRGHPRLRMRHAAFPVDQQARDRWVALMTHAVTQAAFPDQVAAALRTFFDDVATFLINRKAPNE